MGSGRECLVIRTGAFGDVLMASAVLPGLAAQGYRLTLATSWEGETVLRHDPYLNGRIRTWPHLPDKENAETWKAAEAEFDRVVNLVNGMEVSILRHPNQLSYHWPDDQRRRMSGGSYLQQYMRQAGLSEQGRIRFTPSLDEVAWVEQTQAKLGPFVVWTLRGSGGHKVYPYAPMAITQILSQSDHSVVLVGDLGARELEAAVLDAAQDFLGPTGVKRVFSLVGDGSIRRPLALAQKATAVIGPETVVPMSVAHEPHVHKVVILSHSAPSNLTDDWINVTALKPTVPCYPCHRLHTDWTYCPQDEQTGAAACAASLPASLVSEPVLRAIGELCAC
jgi:ADP-heptose:LPS heptosyltransferase